MLVTLKKGASPKKVKEVLETECCITVLEAGETFLRVTPISAATAAVLVGGELIKGDSQYACQGVKGVKEVIPEEGEEFVSPEQEFLHLSPIEAIST